MSEYYEKTTQSHGTLIQRDEKTAEPVYLYDKIPKDINSRRVFICDPM